MLIVVELTTSSSGMAEELHSRGTMEDWDGSPLQMTSQLSYPHSELRTNAFVLALGVRKPLPAHPSSKRSNDDVQNGSWLTLYMHVSGTDGDATASDHYFSFYTHTVIAWYWPRRVTNVDVFTHFFNDACITAGIWDLNEDYMQYAVCLIRNLKYIFLWFVVWSLRWLELVKLLYD